MIRFNAVLGALALGGSLTGCASSAMPSTGADGVRCDFTVAFGSYASGIDTVLHERMTRSLAGDSRVASTLERNWGREGERTLCVRARNRGDVYVLFGEIEAMAAQAGGVRAPTTVARGAANFPAARTGE